MISLLLNIVGETLQSVRNIGRYLNNEDLALTTGKQVFSDVSKRIHRK